MYGINKTMLIYLSMCINLILLIVAIPKVCWAWAKFSKNWFSKHNTIVEETVIMPVFTEIF
jgi:hypothetical protein